ncbi:MAG: hypothetical protein AB8B62_16560 [Roseobacter sp.]
MKALCTLTLSIAFGWALPSAAQTTAEQFAQLLRDDLSPTGTMEGGTWFTNEAATHALGIIYVHIPGSAGSVSIHAGVYGFLDSGWVKLTDVQGLFGSAPKDTQFIADRIKLTTLTTGPDDPRCCPTLPVRWSIDVLSGIATRLN